VAVGGRCGSVTAWLCRSSPRVAATEFTPPSAAARAQPSAAVLAPAFRHRPPHDSPSTPPTSLQPCAPPTHAGTPSPPTSLQPPARQLTPALRHRRPDDSPSSPAMRTLVAAVGLAAAWRRTDHTPCSAHRPGRRHTTPASPFHRRVSILESRRFQASILELWCLDGVNKGLRSARIRHHKSKIDPAGAGRRRESATRAGSRTAGGPRARARRSRPAAQPPSPAARSNPWTQPPVQSHLAQRPRHSNPGRSHRRIHQAQPTRRVHQAERAGEATRRNRQPKPARKPPDAPPAEASPQATRRNHQPKQADAGTQQPGTDTQRNHRATGRRTHAPHPVHPGREQPPDRGKRSRGLWRRKRVARARRGCRPHRQRQTRHPKTARAT
jgi:hypothetical protein